MRKNSVKHAVNSARGRVDKEMIDAVPIKTIRDAEAIAIKTVMEY